MLFVAELNFLKENFLGRNKLIPKKSTSKNMTVLSN